MYIHYSNRQFILKWLNDYSEIRRFDDVGTYPPPLVCQIIDTIDSLNFATLKVKSHIPTSHFGNSHRYPSRPPFHNRSILRTLYSWLPLRKILDCVEFDCRNKPQVSLNSLFGAHNSSRSCRKKKAVLMTCTP